jgi:hypothetical protein
MKVKMKYSQNITMGEDEIVVKAKKLEKDHSRCCI